MKGAKSDPKMELSSRLADLSVELSGDPVEAPEVPGGGIIPMVAASLLKAAA